jgi:hypothetical protein
MAKRRRPPSQGWRTLVHNHTDAIASIDMFVVPTISFGLLYGLLILRQSRRELLWPGVTANPNAEWLARQLTEACGGDEPHEPPRYLIRDRAYGAAFIRRVRAIGISRPTGLGARSPWQNGDRLDPTARPSARRPGSPRMPSTGITGHSGMHHGGDINMRERRRI